MVAKLTEPAQALAKLEHAIDCATIIAHGPNLKSAMVATIEATISPAALQSRIFQPGMVIHQPSLFKDPLTSHDYITGKVGGQTKRSGKGNGWTAPRGARGAPNLAWPCRRSSRPIGPTGGQSFNFAETIVNYAGDHSIGAAAAHTDYALDKAKVPTVGFDAELGVLERGLYLFRDGAVPDDDGVKLAMTNMGKTDGEVKHAWAVVGQTAKRKAGKIIKPRLELKLAGNAGRGGDAFWSAVAQDEDLPENIRAQLDFAMPTSFRVPTALIPSVLCVLRRHGWHDQVRAKQRPCSATIWMRSGRRSG